MKYIIKRLTILTVVLGCIAPPAWGRDAADKLEPKIYVPYQDLARLIDPADKAILMNRSEFEKLLAAAKANTKDAETLELGQVTWAEYSGTISGEKLTLTGELEVVSMSEEPVTVPLGFAQIGLTRVVLDGKPAPLGYDKQGRLTLIITGKGSHQLQIQGTTKLKELSTGGMQFGMSLPAAVAGKMKLSAAGDLEMHATVPVSQKAYDKQTDRTNVELTIGGQDRLTVVLLGNGRQEEDQPILLGESAATVTLTSSHQVMGCLYTVQVLRRGLRELQFRLPRQWTITEVTCPSLVRWSIDTSEEPPAPKILTVRLRSAKVGTTALHIKATARRSAELWHSPRVILTGAAFERGYLMVNTDEGLRVRGEKLTDARREDMAAADSVPGMVSASTGRLYFHWGDNWSVDLELAAVALRRTIKEQQKLQVSPEQVKLICDFEVTAIDRELFDISFVLPSRARRWHIETVKVNNNDTGFEYRIEDEADRQLLRIELARPIRPEKLANVTVVLQHVPSNWHWPSDAAPRSITVPLITSQADTVSGHISISTVGDLDASPTKVPAELEPVPVGRMASLGMPQAVQHAYSYKAAAKDNIQLQISRRRPRIAADAVGVITVQPQQLTGDWRITYTVSRASAKRLYLLADKSLGQKIKITSTTVPTSSKTIVTPDKKTLPLPAELAQQYNLWLLNLDHKAIGNVPIDIHYERPLAEDSLQVPLVRPICEGETQGQISEQLAVQASEELALTVKAVGAKEIDAIDLPPLPVPASRILAAFRLQLAIAAGPNAEITLETAVHENYQIPSALAVSGRLTTYLDTQGGQRTEATFHVANAGEQFLTMRLPKGAQLWSLRVANKQVKPQRSAQGDYQVALRRSRKPIPVRIVYAYQPSETSLEQLKLGPVELPGVEMNRITWNVVPPPGYRITAQETKMQTRNLRRPTPAYLQVYDFLTENYLFGGILMPSLSRARRLAQRVSFAGVAVMSSEAEVSADQEQLKYEQQARPAEPTQALGEAWAGERAMALDITLAKEGRFTLPVDLVPTPGAGPRSTFTGLGTTELIIGLTSQPRQAGWWMLGFVLILTIGMAKALQRVKVKAALFVTVLSLASLLAILWPATTHFANGAFMAGMCLIPLYLLIAFIRWLWCRLRLGGAVSPAAVTAAVLLASVLCMGSSAQARGRAAQVREKDHKKTLPPAIIPYEDDPTVAEESEKVLIPYSRFVRLWNQAHPEEPIEGPRPGTDISLAAVRYKLTVKEEQLNLLLSADIRTYGKDWVVLALPIESLAVTEVTIDGKPAQLHGGSEAGPKGMALMLPGGISGRLQLTAVGKPKYFGRRGSANFSLPPLPGAVMKVILPQEDLELEVDEIEGTPTRRTINGKAEWTVPLGMTRELTLRWLPKIRAGAADRTLSATSKHDVYVFHWAIVGVSNITYRFSAGEYDRFALLLPPGVTLTDLKGANIRDFREVGEKIIEDRAFKTVEVRLHRPAKKRYRLTARWLGELPNLEKPARLSLVQAGDVSRESGTVTLHSAGGMIVKVAKVTGGRRKDIPADEGPRNANITADTAQAVAKYYWPYRPFSLFVQLSRLTVTPKVSLDQLVRISPDRVQLLVEASLKADRGRLFGASFTLPEGYELLSVVGPVVENFYERSNVNGRFLHVKFSSAEQETTMAFVLVRSDIEFEDFQVPTIMFIESRKSPLPEQAGRLAVQVAASLEAQTVASRNLKSIPPRLLRDWLDRDQINRVQFAYRYEVPDPSLTLNIRRQPTQIRVENFAALVVKAASAAYTYRLRYNIAGSPIDHLRFRMPSEYAPLVAVQSPAMRSVTQSDAGSGQTKWDVALINEVTGIVDITVNFALPLDASTQVLPIPRIETAAPQGYRAIAAIQNISRHKISVKDKTNLDDLPVSEQQKLISPQLRQSLQYVFQSFEDNWSLSLDFTPAKPAARIQAVVDLLALTTVIDRNGRCRYEAKVALQNRSEQFLRVKAPQGLRLWSATVAGQPVKPVMAADSPAGEVLIPLIKTSPGGLPYDVYLYFAGQTIQGVKPLNGITKLKPPRISILGMPVMQTTWSLRLPDGYRYMRPGGNMSPVAGTVEVLSLGIEARLKQLGRLDKAYRDIAGTSTQREEIAEANWELLNAKVVTEIEQAEKYLDAKRNEVSQKEYHRLRSKLGGQRSVQQRVIGGNRAYVQRQQELALNDMNVFLNDSSVNPGVAEGARNGVLLQKPEFVITNEDRQIARLQQELQTAEEQQEALEDISRYDAEKVDKARVTTTKANKLILGIEEDAGMSRILTELSKESAAQIEQKQQQVKQQLEEMQDSRMGRYFRKGQQRLQPSPDRKPKRPAKSQRDLSRSRRAYGGGYGGYGGGGYGGGGYGGYGGRRAEGDEMASVTAAGQIQPYVAKGTYSLPVALPAGEVRLDFAKPLGEAELSIWAVPVTAFHNLYSSLTAVAALLLMFGAVKIWPDYAKRQPISTKRIIVYIVLLVVPSVILGLLGLLISLSVILLIEAGRSISALTPNA